MIGRDLGRGEVVEPAKQLFEIADVRRMWIRLQVQKEDLQKIALGQVVDFHVDGVPPDLDSKITWISTEVNEATRTLQVRAEVENGVSLVSEDGALEQRPLRASTFGTGHIHVRTSPDAMVVPNESVQTERLQRFVFVQGWRAGLRRTRRPVRHSDRYAHGDRGELRG